MGERFLVRGPTGSGKTRRVLGHVLGGRAKPSIRRWNRKLSQLVISGPNDKVRGVWLRELALLVSSTFFDGEDEARIRGMSVGGLRRWLESREVEMPRFHTFQKLGKARRQGCRWIVLDEWHALPLSIRDVCARFGRDKRMIRPWYLGGQPGRATVYLVSATPLNPVLEKEDDELARGSRAELSKAEESARLLEAVGRASAVLKTVAGASEPTKSERFLDYSERCGFKELRAKRSRKWKLPGALRWTETDREDRRACELEGLRKHVEGRADRLGYRQEYAWAVGLVRTKWEPRGGHRTSTSARSSFGFPYSVLHSTGRQLPAAQWLSEEHGRVGRLVQLLRDAKVVTRRGGRDQLSKNKKALIFCQHRAVAKGLVEALKVRFGSREREAIRTNVERAESGKKLEADLEHAFNDPRHPLRILVVTDVLSESIDLHLACNVVVHYELPWSPLRLFQRVGRLTRLKTWGGRALFNRNVRVGHVVIPGSVEEERVNRLVRRILFLDDQGLWPGEFSAADLMNGLIGGGPSLHFAEELSRLSASK